MNENKMSQKVTITFNKPVSIDWLEQVISNDICRQCGYPWRRTVPENEVPKFTIEETAAFVIKED